MPGTITVPGNIFGYILIFFSVLSIKPEIWGERVQSIKSNPEGNGWLFYLPRKDERQCPPQ